MKRDLAHLAREQFDVLIIGGGIMGAAIARDAALRGLKVALVEKNDFASGTSSRSSKLIHGGLRYFEQGRLRLVREACRERAILHRIAPHLVKPLSILLPIYRDSPRPLWQIRLGLWLYDHIAGGNIAPHRILSHAETMAEENNLQPNGLVGGAIFYDCQEDDSRFVIETFLSATEAGASAANYAEVIGFHETNGKPTGARVRDRLTNDEFEITAKIFVNATGHWLDQIVNLAHITPPPRIRRTKGTHILLPTLTRHHALLLSSPCDNRVFFALPWHGSFTLVGTTDTDYTNDPDRVYPDEADIIYLLDSLRRYLPQLYLEPRAIHAAFAGLRTLTDTSSAPSHASREHRIISHPNGLLSILGGKFTTHRLIAEQTTDLLFQHLGRKSPRCVTAHQPLPPRETDVDSAVADEMALTLTDVMWRRLGLFLSDQNGRNELSHIARRMGKLLRWSDAEREKQIADYFAELERNLPR